MMDDFEHKDCVHVNDFAAAQARIAELEAENTQRLTEAIEAAGESVKYYQLAKDNLDLAETINTKLAAAESTLAACAAGEWRTDVENAPKDGSRFLAMKKDGKMFVTKWTDSQRGEDLPTDKCQPRDLAAFATINPPEINP